MVLLCLATFRARAQTMTYTYDVTGLPTMIIDNNNSSTKETSSAFVSSLVNDDLIYSNIKLQYPKKT